MKIEILTGGSELIDRISGEWTDLCNEGASSEPFLRPEWFSTFVNSFENEISLITVRRDGKLRALLPLVRKVRSMHGLPARKLQAVYNLNTQRFDLIHGADESEKKAVVQAIWSAINGQRGWDVMEARMVKKDSWLNEVLHLAEKAGHRTGIWQMDSAPFITVPKSTGNNGSEEEIEATLRNFLKGSRKHLIHDTSRRRRRLEEIGKVEFVFTRSFTPEQTKAYFDLEAKGWKGRQGTAVTDDPRVIRLHEDFAHAVAAKDALLVHELKLDGKTIGMSLAIKYLTTTVHWKTSYDEEYARFSPGKLLFRELLTECIRNGSTELDLLSPATKGKIMWANGEREHVAFYLFRRGLYGELLWNWKFRLLNRMRETKVDKPDNPLFEPRVEVNL